MAGEGIRRGNCTELRRGKTKRNLGLSIGLTDSSTTLSSAGRTCIDRYVPILSGG